MGLRLALLAAIAVVSSVALAPPAAAADHDICSPDPYVNGYPAPTIDQLAFHPKPLGQAKLAAVAGDYLKARPITA